MVGVGDVTDRVHVLVGGAEPTVGPDAVVDDQAGGLGELGDGLDPDPDDEQVDVERAAVAEGHRRAVTAGGDGGHLDAGAEVDAVLAVEVGEDLGDLRTEDAQEGELERLEDGHRGAVLPGGGRDLEPDPAAADDADAGALGEVLAEGEGVVEGAQIDDGDAGLVGHRQRSRPRPGGQHELVVVEPRAAGLDATAGASIAVAAVPVRRSMPCAAYHARSCTAASSGVPLPSSRSLERGGRS